jgi:S1-C subfamily serine protease
LLHPAPRDAPPDSFAKGYVGVRLRDIDGIVITEVVPNSPADKSGLKTNDQLLKIDGTSFHTVEETADFIRHSRPGNTLRLEIKRDGKPLTIRLTVGARPADGP